VLFGLRRLSATMNRYKRNSRARERGIRELWELILKRVWGVLSHFSYICVSAGFFKSYQVVCSRYIWREGFVSKQQRATFLCGSWKKCLILSVVVFMDWQNASSKIANIASIYPTRSDCLYEIPYS